MDYKQIIEPESQETNINIDYLDKKVTIYTNKSTVMNRMERAGYKSSKIENLNGEICSTVYEFKFSEFPRLISARMFRCD